jgi:hypothetical protein
VCDHHFYTFLKVDLFPKNSPIFSIFDQIKQSKHTFQGIFHALYDPNNKTKKKLFLVKLDHTLDEP